jgi:hypothetical protein
VSLSAVFETAPGLLVGGGFLLFLPKSKPMEAIRERPVTARQTIRQ